MRNLRSALAAGACISCLAIASRTGIAADSSSDIQSQLKQLQEQNELLQRQLSKQNELIENLSRKVSALENSAVVPTPATPAVERSLAPAEPAGGFQFGKVSISGEGGVAFFHSGSKGTFPNSEFRVDEAKLFVEAPVMKDIYAFTEINLFQREDENGNLNVGELYLDFENLSRFFGRDRWVNLRVGRMDVPFGEEYLTRDAIDNPLISHSLSDLWGVDEGVELYGNLAKVHYAIAVQNGSHSAGHDYTGDKSVAGRLSYDAADWLHLSLSGMRTGDLDTSKEGISEIWFANGFIRPLDQNANSTTFHGELVEGDVHVSLPQGHFKAAGGYLHSDDNGTGADNERDVYYYYAEGLYRFTKHFYAAGRYSQILIEDGYPLVGNGDYMRGVFGPRTKNLWRLSLGLGYRPGPNFLLKGEYTFNGGRTVTGESRIHENLFALEAAFKF